MLLTTLLRRAAVVVAGAALTVTGLGSAPAHAAAFGPFAVIGPTGSLYYSANGGLGYRDLGGRLMGDPAVGRATDGRTYLLAQGLDRDLYVRSLTHGWTRFSKPGSACSDPDVDVVAEVLHVACRGGNDVLYYGRASLPRTGLPVVQGFTRVGGVLTQGPGIEVRAESGREFVTFMVVGQPYGPTGENLYYSQLGYEDHVRWDVRCSDAPTFEDNAGYPVVACADGGRALLYQGFLGRPQDQGAPGGLAVVSDRVPGQIQGRPGLTIRPDGRAVATAVGVDGGVYRAVLTTRGTGGFRRVAGAAVGGVGAVSPD